MFLSRAGAMATAEAVFAGAALDIVMFGLKD
jgi:hypothetical protein